MEYSRFNTPKTTSNAFYIEFPGGPRLSREEYLAKRNHTFVQDLDPEWNKLIRDDSVPNFCCSCGQDHLQFIGLGQYQCQDCGTMSYDNYGKVRQTLELLEFMTEKELMEKSGLSRMEIKRLVEAGYLARSLQGLHVV